MCDKRNQKITYILSFLIPFLLTLLFYFLKGIAPLGDKVILTGDLDRQFVDFFSYFKHIFTSQNDSLYTLHKNLGGDMMGLASYYTHNPLLFLLFLFPGKYISIGVALLFSLQTALLGLCMSLYLNKRIKSSQSSLLFSTSYSFMGFIFGYQPLMIYFSNLVLLPLILLLFESIVEDSMDFRKNKPSKYIYSLLIGLYIYMNYYLGFMLMIFLVIYYASMLIVDKKRIKASLTLMIHTLTGIMLSAFSLIPTVLSLKGEKSTSMADLSFHRLFRLLNLPAMFFTGMARNDRMPFIYSSVLVLLCVVFYFLTGSFKLRDKISTLFLMAALILSMYLNPLDAVWHGFNNPVGFPWRYSYFLTLLMILTGYRFFSEFTKKSEELLIKGKTFLAAALIFLLYFVFLLVTVNPYFDKERAILNILLTFVYILLFFMLLKREALEKRIRHSSRLFIPLIFILLFGELTYNSCISFYSLNGDGEELSVFNEKYDEIKASVDYIKSRDDSLYRLEKDFYRTPNDPMMFDYIGLTHSSSCEKEYIRHFLSRWGFRDTGLYAFYNLGSTSFADSFLGVKYYISRFDQIHKPYYYLDQCKNHFAYLNPYALGFMSLAPKALEEVDLNSGNTFELQNNIANAYGKYDIYQKADYEIELENVTMTEEKGLLKFNVSSEEASFNSEDSENTEALVHFKIDIKKEGSLYYFFDAPQMQAAEVFVNGDYREPYFTTTNWSVLCAGIYKPGDKVDVCLKLNEEAISISQACFYYEDTKALSSWYEKASEGNAELKEITSSHLKGSIRASKDDIILFSIPYEEAWNTKINGKKGEKIPLLKELLAVKVPDSGELVIEMQYIPSGLLPGIIISILAIALLLLLWIREKNN